MLIELLIRFLVGGLVVSFFAFLGDLLKPKSFAGLFGAAPSVALATLSLTIKKEGAMYAVVEAHSMMAGAVAFFVYANLVSWLLMRHKVSAVLSTTISMGAWFIVGFALWAAWLR